MAQNGAGVSLSARHGGSATVDLGELEAATHHALPYSIIRCIRCTADPDAPTDPLRLQ